MASPSMTDATLGNVANAVVLAAGATLTYNLYPGATGTGNVAVATSTVFQTQLFVSITAGGTVSTTSGFTVKCYAGGGNGAPPAWETIPSTTYTSETVAASGTASRKIFLDTTPGWRVSVTNNDPTNAVTLTLTDDTLSGIS